MKLTKEKKEEIQKEYLKLTSFKNGELKQLAEKFGLTVAELLEIIDL